MNNYPTIQIEMVYNISGERTKEWVTLPFVPRVGDIVTRHDIEFEVKDVIIDLDGKYKYGIVVRLRNI